MSETDGVMEADPPPAAAASGSALLFGGEQEEEEEAEEGGGGYMSFRGRQARGVLYRLSPMQEPVYAQVKAYVHGGALDADLRFAREVHSLANTSGRKDFDLFWESPWIEEHIRDTTRKRKVDAQQRAMAVRSYIRRAADPATTATGEGGKSGVDAFLSTVDRLTEWEDRHGSRDMVKTVSRSVQGFERGALTHLLEVLDQPVCATMRHAVLAHMDPDTTTTSSVACSLRRSERVFHVFAAVVAMEMVWAEATNGTRNTTIYMCKQLEERRRESHMALIRELSRADTSEVPRDTLGLPLMRMNACMCVSKGVLVVMPGSASATYILDILPDGKEELGDVHSIKILRFVDETRGSALGSASGSASA